MFVRFRQRVVTVALVVLFVLSVVESGITAQRLGVWAPGIGAAEVADTDVWGYVAKEFEKTHPGVKVEIRITPQGLEEQYVVAYVAGVGPDVGYMYNEMMPGFISKGMLLPIDRFITKQDEANYYDINYTRFQGKRWGIPLFAGSRIFFYNNSYLLETGLEVPDTWEQMRAAAKKLTFDKDGDGKPERWGFRLGWNGTTYGGLNDNWDPWFLQAGGTWFSPDGKQTAFNSSPGREALEFMHKLVYEDGSTLMGGGTGDFLNGTVSMMYVGEYMSGRIRQRALNMDYGVKVGLMNKTRKTWFAADYWGIFNTKTDPQLAWDWVKFSTSGPMMRYLHQYTVQLPVARDEGNPFPDDPAFRIFIPDMHLMQARPIVPEGSKVYQAVWDSLRRAMLNEIPIRQALEEAERQANRILVEAWREFEK